MSSMLAEHGNNQDAQVDDSVLSSFNLFLSLMTPVEFTKLLRSRVRHLLQTWPPSSSANEPHRKTFSFEKEPLNLSMESLRSFTSFFRMQDAPTPSELGPSLTASSQNNIQQHLYALETLLSCLSPKELQNLIQSRLKEGGRERTAAIRGLLDVMRSAANDETPENLPRVGSSALHLNSRSDTEDNGAPSRTARTVNVSPGTPPIPRVKSPGTRDESADDSITTNQGELQELHSLIMEQSNLSSRQSIPLLSPTVSTSKFSSSTDVTPIDHANMQDILESQVNSRSMKFESSTKGKDSILKSPSSRSSSRAKASSIPYTKITQPSRRTRSAAVLISQSSASESQTKLRIPAKPRRKSERLSMKNQSTANSNEASIHLNQASQKEPKILPSSPSDIKSTSTSPTSPISPTSHSHITPNVTSDRASSFAYSQDDGRKSPPGPVLRAVDWSSTVRSNSSSSNEDESDEMEEQEEEEEEEEEELDELADDTSDADSRVPEIVDGWNSHITETKSAHMVHTGPPTMSQISPSSPVGGEEELARDEVILTLPPPTLHSEPVSLEPLIVPSTDPSTVVKSDVLVADRRVDAEPDILSNEKKAEHGASSGQEEAEQDVLSAPRKDAELGDALATTTPQGHPMDIDLVSRAHSGMPPATPTASDTDFPTRHISQPPPMYPSYYVNQHHLSSHIPHPQASPVHPNEIHHQVPSLHAAPHSSSQLSTHSHHHTSHMPNVPLPSYPPSQPPPPHQSLNPYPPSSHTYDYPPPPPQPAPLHHMSSYPPQHPTYATPPSWYGSSYFQPQSHQPPPSHPSYPPPHPMPQYSLQQPNVPIPPTQDHRPAHMSLPHLSHPQSYAPSHYHSTPPQGSPPQFHSTQYSAVQPSQGLYPPRDNHNLFPSQTTSSQYNHHPQTSHPPFSPSGPPPPHVQPSPSLIQQNVPLHAQIQSTSAHLPHHIPPPQSHPASSSQSIAHPSSQTQISPPDKLPLDTVALDHNRSGPQTANSTMTTSMPKPPSPIIPPPSGPRPPPPLPPVILLPPPQRRSPSPPVKPPEAPKRFFPKRKSEEEGDVNFFRTVRYDDPNVQYTDEVGIKETAVIRRRCHNCHSAEAPSWRKSKLHAGKILCNKCGIYESTHMIARPLKTRPRRLLLNGERDYHFEMFKNSSPMTPSGSPTLNSIKRRKRRESVTSDNDDEFDLDE